MGKKSIFSAVLLSMMCLVFAGCSAMAEDVDSRTDASSVQVKPIIANNDEQRKDIDFSQLSRESCGYGQGIQTDDKNRTLGALDFNAKYGNLNACAINEEDEKITLTFDQGYENGYTSQILDTLKEKNVKAVFFLLEDYAQKNPQLVRRMIDEGHILGNHSVHHYSMPSLSQEQCESEIMDFHQYMKDEYNYEMTLFRPPMGEYSEYSLGVTANCGYKTMLWSFAYADWDTQNQPDKQVSLEKLTNAAHPGAIYLLHSVSSTNAEILGELIDSIRQSGYEFN